MEWATSPFAPGASCNWQSQSTWDVNLTHLLPCALSGTDQAAWGEREVDTSNEVAQALSLMEPPVNAPRQRVEQAIVSARGNIEEAKQVGQHQH